VSPKTKETTARTFAIATVKLPVQIEKVSNRYQKRDDPQ